MVKKRVTGTAVYSPSGLLQKISVCNDDNRCVEFYATPNHTNSFVEVGGNNNNYNFNRRKATPRIKQTSVAAKQAEEVIGDVKLVETKLQKDTKTWRAFLTRANIKTLVGVALTIWSVGLMFFYGGALSASLLNSIKAFIAAGLPQKVRWVITWVKRYDYIKRYIHPLGPFRFAMNYYIGHPTAL
ncbi:hypothetical protein EBT25_10945, partial [bacterium]|nr:hypothetical protein [bacterium]